MTLNAKDRRDALFGDAFLKRLEYLEIVARKVFASNQRGERRTKKLGAGLEFADHRRYSPGDDFKHIDWNVYARLGKLLLRLYEEEEDLHVYILIDASTSMTVGNSLKLDQARRIGAALSYIALANLDRASLSTFSEKLGPRLMPVRGKSQIFRVFDFLAHVEPGGVTSFEAGMRGFVHDTKRRGLVVILSDFYAQDGWESGLNYLRYHRFEPVVVQLTDDRELNPDLRGDILLIDAETRAEKELTLTPRLLARYREAHAAFSAELETFCKGHQIPYFKTSAQQSFDTIVLEMLRSGGLLT